MEITRHFTATTLVVHDSKVLLHMHKKLKRWLPVGGHLDRDELPLDAARREVWEEAGLEVEFYNPKKLRSFPEVQELCPPVHLLLEDINPFHQHIDFVFFARSSTFEFAKHAEELDTLRWFSLEELQTTPNMPEDVIFLSREALSLI